MSWEEVPLGDLADIRSGGTPSRGRKEYYGGTIPWAKISDLDEISGLVNQTEETISDAGLSAIRGRLFPAGTLLFAIYGSVGKMAFAGVTLTTNQAILGISVDHRRIDQRFLFHSLAAKRSELLGDGVGVTQKNLSAKYMRDLKIPLPPIGEQRRIAGILDAADALRCRRREALVLLDTLPGAIFAEMFGDPVSNPHGFKLGAVGDLLDDVKYGTSNKAGAEGKLPILRMGNLTYEGRMDLRDLKRIDLPEKDLAKHTVRSGDILFNRTNSADLVGKTAIFREEEPYAFAGYLVRARVSEGNRPEYVAGYLNSPHGKKVLRNMAKNIVGMANINAKEMQKIPILLAPRDKQARYADRCRQIEDRRETLMDHLSHTELLFTSLQARAFAGEL